MRIQGRVDDMIVVRGVNVFPSQIESVLMQIPEVGDHFQIVVDRAGPMDVMAVKIEVTESTLSDRVGALMQLEERVAKQLRDVLMVNARWNSWNEAPYLGHQESRRRSSTCDRFRLTRS